MTQRVIKFRCWDHEEGVMLSDNHDGVMIQMNSGRIGYYDDDGNFQEGKYTLMQFTGLLDKHGKEIYEGDIRKEMLDGLFVGDPQREHYFVMVYIEEWTMFAWLSITSGEYHKYLTEGASALDTEMYWTYPAGQDEPNNVELVGDIYTTPELVDPKMIERDKSLFPLKEI